MDPFCLYVASLAFNLLPAPPNHLEEKCQRSQYIRQITLDDEDNDSERLIALKIRQRDVDDECVASLIVSVRGGRKSRNPFFPRVWDRKHPAESSLLITFSC